MRKAQLSEQAYSELLKSRYPDQTFIDDVLCCLQRAEGIAGFIADTACLEQGAKGYHDIDYENLWRTVQSIELEIKDAIIMINDYWQRQLKEDRHEK